MAIVAGSKGKLITFKHSKVGELHIRTGLNSIEWGYKLNTATFPTYGGEVVQILSASVETVTFGGDLQTHEDLMKVYSYFFKYFQVASQGKGSGSAAGITSYNQEHMIMEYPERGWEFHIQPMQAPGFHIGRERIISDWRITAHVDHFKASDLTDKIAQEAEAKARVDRLDRTASSGDLSFFKLKEGVGYTESSPFSDPFSNVTGIADEELITSQGPGVIKANAEYFAQLIKPYTSGDFQSLLYGFDSGPSDGVTNVQALKEEVDNGN